MGLLDFDDSYVPPFTPKHKFERPVDNFTELQNLGRKKVSEDFEDSPYADRKPDEAFPSVSE